MKILNTLYEFLEKIAASGAVGRWVWPAVLFLLCACCLFWGVSVLPLKKHRKRDVVYFILLAVAVLLAALVTALLHMGWLADHTAVLSLAGNVAQVFVPGLLVLHIQKQVSHKDVTWPILILWLAVPLGLSVWLGVQFSRLPEGSAALLFPPSWEALYFLYAAVCLTKCYLLCFNVFYQMPGHMRSPAFYILGTVTLVVFANLLRLVQPQGLEAYNIPILLTGVALSFLYKVLRTSSSANLIVTGRDFVFGSQDTMVLVLSLSGRVLDWNKKGKAYNGPLPAPRYRESFDNYKARLLKQGHGQLSPHGGNIVLLNLGDREIQYLIKTTPIGTGQRQFGYLAEISEVSQVYTVLRLFEEIATVDQMTNLLNRNAYLRAVQQYEQEGVAPLCIIVGDVNNLKMLNDTLGHLVGDRMLKAVAAIITSSMPEGAKAYRIGGDEFVLLLPGRAAGDAAQFVEAVNRNCAAVHDDEYGTPTISWGYAVRSDLSQAYNDVFTEADHMMYAQKKQRFQFTSSGMVPQAKPGEQG